MKLDPHDLTECDKEPIHIPGSIQPHGVLLVAGRDDLVITNVAGDVEGRLGVEAWQGRTLGALIGDDLAARLARITDSPGFGGFVGQMQAASRETFDVSVQVSGDHLVVEVEPAGPPQTPAGFLAGLEAASAAFERTPSLKTLCERAAVEFRRITGFDRVMIYRFLDDEAGVVLAEDRDPALPSFLNHHFPGSDIPKQARALYVRNLVRVIPDIRYQPAPLRPEWTGSAALDMSDCVLRSVSPIHLQYMQNMDVGASASVSIVKDGVLWGLIACHHAQPRLLTYDQRAGCRALAGALARQIKAKEEAEGYRERLRLRGFEDEVVSGLALRATLDEALKEALSQVRKMLDADGVAVLRGAELMSAGETPREIEIRELAAWALARGAAEPLATDRLGEVYAPARAFADKAAGLVVSAVSAEEPFVILWFRAEAAEVVNWAGNPHKALDLKPGETLTPRASFEAWSETVSGRARRWTLAEVETAGRLRQALLDARQNRRLKELNLRLTETLEDKDNLLQQKELLLREVNHRIQNSLQLVSSFLGLQARSSEDQGLKDAFEEARRRLSAVALVHRRLYRADQIENVDLARYLEELCAEMLDSMGPEWDGYLTLNIAPVLIPTDRAVTLGLVLTELVINANKYAYDGAPGPIEISLEEQGSKFRLIVADHGRGKHEPRQGFGTRMMSAMVNQLGGELEYKDNKPGLRAVLTASVSQN